MTIQSIVLSIIIKHREIIGEMKILLCNILRWVESKKKN